MNGLQVSNPAIIVRAKLCGLKPGFPDMSLPVRGYAACPGLYIEQKRKHSKWETCGWDCASDDQLWWRDRLREQGYQVEVSHRSGDSIAYLRTYLDMEES